MKTTFIVCAYNAYQTIGQTIDSILLQSGDYNVVVIDDGSEDATGDLIRSYCLKYPHISLVSLKNNVSIGEARNVGLIMTSSPYICFVDADDRISHDFLRSNLDRIVMSTEINSIDQEILSERYREVPDIVLSQCKYQKHDGSFVITGDLAFLFEAIFPNAFFPNYHDDNWFLHYSSSFFRKTVFHKYGGYLNIKAMEDTEYLCRCLIGDLSLAYIERPLYEYRYTPGSLIRGRLEDTERTQIVKDVYDKISEYLYLRDKSLLKKTIEIPGIDIESITNPHNIQIDQNLPIEDISRQKLETRVKGT